MDQDRTEAHDLAWWGHVVFDGWRDRAGPRYERLATSLVDAVERGVVPSGARVPAERMLAETLGVSRGTVVACFDRLVDAGVVRRVQGAGTFVVGRPAWSDREAVDRGASVLLRRIAAGVETIDLSHPVPADTSHLPPVDWPASVARMAGHGHGLDPTGLPELRDRIAAHLARHHGLPTDADQIIVTTGARHAIALVHTVLGDGGAVVAGCPNEGALSAHLSGRARVAAVPVDAAGLDVDAVARALRRRGRASIFVAPTGHDPTGAVMPSARRHALLEVAARTGSTIVEDLSSADLVLDEPAPPPLGAGAPDVVVIGSVSKLLWAGLHIGWIRAPVGLRDQLAARVAAEPAAAVPAQLIAADLLAAVDEPWLVEHRRSLALRRDRLRALLADALPAFRPGRPAAGLALWVEVPVVETDALVHVAARHGLSVVAGRDLCTDGRHHGAIRLSFAAPLETLALAVERLASAWELHSQALAATPKAATPKAAAPRSVTR